MEKEAEVDHFQAGIEASKKEIDPNILESFLSKLFQIEQHYPETKKVVRSCILALRKPSVTIMDLLVATFVINEGITIKYDIPEDEPDELADFERLLENIKDLDDY